MLSRRGGTTGRRASAARPRSTRRTSAPELPAQRLFLELHLPPVDQGDEARWRAAAPATTRAAPRCATSSPAMPTYIGLRVTEFAPCRHERRGPVRMERLDRRPAAAELCGRGAGQSPPTPPRAGRPWRRAARPATPPPATSARCAAAAASASRGGGSRGTVMPRPRCRSTWSTLRIRVKAMTRRRAGRQPRRVRWRPSRSISLLRRGEHGEAGDVDGLHVGEVDHHVVVVAHQGCAAPRAPRWCDRPSRRPASTVPHPRSSRPWSLPPAGA